jgi:hypothetical protein
MHIGITLIFKDEYKNEGVLMSTVLDFNKQTIFKLSQRKGLEIGEFYGYEYLGINDLFMVAGSVRKNNQILGRNTLYEVNTIKKAIRKTIPSNKLKIKKKHKNLFFYTCSLLFLCSSKSGEDFTISIITLVDNRDKSIFEKINELSKNNLFIEKIKMNSKENIKDITYVGVESFFPTDLKFDVFQKFTSDLQNIDVDEEILSKVEVLNIIDDIINE